MTEDVLVTIKGLQLDSAEENVIEVINIGRLSEINNKIYVKYDEMIDGEKNLTRNLIKIEEGNVEIIKKGVVSSHMHFCANEKTMSLYNTPFGSLYIGILASKIAIEKNKNNINILIDYTLEVNNEEISECKVKISIKPQDRAEYYSLESI